MKIRKIAIFGAISAILLPILWFVYQYQSILSTGETAKPEKSDVIIILGASVWPGGPSPALQARIEHGAFIYAQGLAEHFILTGGLGPHPPTEAEAMKEVLVEAGIEQEVMLLEKSSTNTLENLKFSKLIMDEHGFESAIIVTDVFHIKRALLMAEDLDIKATGAPVKESPLYTNRNLRHDYIVREVLAITWYYFYRVIGPVLSAALGSLLFCSIRETCRQIQFMEM